MESRKSIYVSYDAMPEYLMWRIPFAGSSAWSEREPDFVSYGNLAGEELAAVARQAGSIYYIVYSYNNPIAWVTTGGDVHIVEQRFKKASARIQDLCREWL